MIKNTTVRSLPWNQDTFFGYVGEILYSLFGGGAFLFVNGSLLLLFISIYFHHVAFAEIFRRSLKQKTDENKIDNEFLCKLIQFNITVRKYTKIHICFYKMNIFIGFENFVGGFSTLLKYTAFIH